jgi:hypothetical protein
MQYLVVKHVGGTVKYHPCEEHHQLVGFEG